jgi:hypothetical protein
MPEEVSNLLGNQLLRATVSRFEADRQEAMAIIDLYLNSAVGIGDHPNIVHEIHKATKMLAEAEDALDALRRHFFDQTTEEK